MTSSRLTSSLASTGMMDGPVGLIVPMPLPRLARNRQCLGRCRRHWVVIVSQEGETQEEIAAALLETDYYCGESYASANGWLAAVNSKASRRRIGAAIAPTFPVSRAAISVRHPHSPRRHPPTGWHQGRID